MGIAKSDVQAANLAATVAPRRGNLAYPLTGRHLVTDRDRGRHRLIGGPKPARMGHAHDGDAGHETGKGHSAASHGAYLLPCLGGEVYAAVPGPVGGPGWVKGPYDDRWADRRVLGEHAQTLAGVGGVGPSVGRGRGTGDRSGGRCGQTTVRNPLD